MIWLIFIGWVIFFYISSSLLLKRDEVCAKSAQKFVETKLKSINKIFHPIAFFFIFCMRKNQSEKENFLFLLSRTCPNPNVMLFIYRKCSLIRKMKSFVSFFCWNYFEKEKFSLWFLLVENAVPTKMSNKLVSQRKFSTSSRFLFFIINRSFFKENFQSFWIEDNFF